MIPFSISIALTIDVGYSIGGKNLLAAKQYSFTGVLGGIAFLAISAVFLLLFMEKIASLYTNDPAVIELAGKFFIIAIFITF